jgi:anoctamin-10
LGIRTRDWLYGVRSTQPDPAQSHEPETDAERLRVIYQIMTSPRDEGGLEITPNYGEWENVGSIFTLHDQQTNRSWIMDWSRKTFLTRDDLDRIRDKFGEKVRSVVVSSSCT